MTEREFLARMAEEADCGLLLDVNNVYVTSVNHDFDPVEYLRALPHEPGGADPPGGPQRPRHPHHRHPRRPGSRPGLGPLRAAVELTGPVSTLIEWDDKLPPFPEVHAEVLKARRFVEGIGA